MSNITAAYVKEMFDLAITTASYSKDPSTKVGAVAAVNKRVIGTGRNGFPPGVSDNPSLYENRDLKLLLVNHAEKNLISICGDQIRGGDIFVTFPVCNDCAGMLITAGVARVFTIVPKNFSEVWYYRWKLSKALFKEVGIEVYEYENQDPNSILAPSTPFTVSDAVKQLSNFLKGNTKETSLDKRLKEVEDTLRRIEIDKKVWQPVMPQQPPTWMPSTSPYTIGDPIPPFTITCKND